MVLGWPDVVILALVALIASGVQATVGFGSMLVGLGLAAQRYPVTELLPLLVPVSAASAGAVLWLDWRVVDRRLLARRVLPLMLPGLAAGWALFRGAGPDLLRQLYGVLLVVLAAWALAQHLRGSAGPSEAGEPGASQPAAAAPWIVAAGVVHGLCAAGGPLLVHALGRARLEPRALRGTLAAVWLGLNLLLCCAYAGEGRLQAATLPVIAWLGVGAGLGVALGQRLQGRLSARALRTGLLALLLIAGLSLTR